MQFKKILAIILLPTLLLSCLPNRADGQKRIADMDYDELATCLEDVFQPIDSLSYALARYVLMSRQQKDLGKTLQVLKNVEKKSRRVGHDGALDADIFLGKAVACVERMDDRAIIDWVKRAKNGIADHVSPQTTMRRYTQAALVCLLTTTDEGNELAAATCLEAIEYSKKNSEIPPYAELYSFLGQAYFNMGEVQAAMTALTQALCLAHDAGNAVQEARAYAAMARCMRNENLLLQARVMAEKAYGIIRHTPAGEAKCLTCRVVGWTFEDRQQPDSALFYLNMAKSICDTMHFVRLGREIVRQDIDRIQTEGCQQPDTTTLARAQCLHEYTQTIIDMERQKMLEEEVMPEVSHAIKVVRYTIFACCVVLILAVGVVLTYRYNKKREEAEKDAHLQTMASRMADAHSRLKAVSTQLDHTEKSRHELSVRMTDMAGKLSETESLLRETQEQLNGKEAMLRMFRERDREQKADLKEIKTRFINKDFNIDDAYVDPELFTRLFLSAHPNFEKGLKERAPSVSQHDTLLCILIVLDAPKEEVARVLKIRPDSLNVARHRLRKRLNLAREENLFTWLRSLL